MTHEGFRDWLDGMGRGWVDGDTESLVELFTVDAVYHEDPFDEPMAGQDAIREYWDAAGQGHRDVAFESDVLDVTGDRGIAHFSASFTRAPGGMHVDVEGILVAEFDDQGKCRSFREWWHRREHDLQDTHTTPSSTELA